MDKSICMKCKVKTGNENPQIAKTKNNHPVIHSKCSKCGKNKIKMMSKADFQNGQKGEGLLGSLLGLPGGKIPGLGSIPLIGDLLF